VAVCSIGHAHPRMVSAIQEQAARLIHCSNLYQIREQGLLAQRLTETVVGAPGKVFFCNSGAEANETLIKLARRFGHATPGSEGPRTDVITLSASFHGRTLAGIAATAQSKVKEGFAPLMPGFVHAAFNDLGAVKDAITLKTVAVMLEVVQGEGGVHVARPDFLKALARLCREQDLLLMFDEVQCGIGRAGNWCGWKAVLGDEAGEVEPDAVSWAKGLGGGYPLGGIWVRSRAVSADSDDGALLCDVLGPGTHGSTYGGSPLASVTGMAVLEEIEESGLCERAREQGAKIIETIESWGLGLVREVRGLGLMLGIVLDLDRLSGHEGLKSSGAMPSLFLTKELMVARLLTVPAGPEVVRLLPPLNVSDDEVEKALSILKQVLGRIDTEAGASRATPSL
jgi:acetylornithine/N-succinyldiaminopimelate aminotransferase